MEEIVCGCVKDHQCNEDASVYETRDGKRYSFKDEDKANEFIKDNYQNILMGSVACSICGNAMIDNAWKIDI